MMINDNEKLLQLSEVLVNIPTAWYYKSREVFETDARPHDGYHRPNFTFDNLNFGSKFSTTGRGIYYFFRMP